MEKLLILEFLLLMQFMTTNQQQCKFVPVCDEQQGPDIQNRGTKGERGDVGRPGKMGPSGPSGQKGEPGPLADTEVLSNLITTLLMKVDEQERKLNQTYRKLEELYNYVIPDSCQTALLRGRQTLKSGEEAFCADGWRVFQHRFDGSLNFNRNWVDYKNGFGNLSTEFWLGLDWLHRFTNSSTRCRLRVELWDFGSKHAFAEYKNFRVGREQRGYELSLSGYSGSAGNSMLNSAHVQNGMRFTTPDRDYDLHSSRQCAVTHGGPWWHHSCGYARLNGPWLGADSTDYNSMSWYHWKTRWGGIKSSMMKVQCD